MLGRSSPLVCPLASLGRASPSLDAQCYHHPLSSSPLDPQAYQMPRDLEDLDREDTPSPPPLDHYQHYGRSRRAPMDSYRMQDRHYQRSQRSEQNYDISPAMERHFLVNQKPPSSVGSSKTYHLSRSSSSSLDQPFVNSSNFVEYYVPRGINKVLEEQFLHRTDQRKAYRKEAIDLRSPSLDSVYQERYGVKVKQPQTYCAARNAPAIRRGSSPDLDVATHLVDSFTKLNRASPSLDQGYHTLVSPSPGPSTPGPWTELNITANAYKGKRLLSRNNPFDRLPDDTLLKIFSWLDSSEFGALSRVCKRFEYLSWHPTLWRTITLKGEHLNADKAIRCVFRKLCMQGGVPAGASVERVFIRDGCRLTERGLALLARRCPELTHLQLQGCIAVGTQAVNDLTARCTNLQHLDLTGCTRFSWCMTQQPQESIPIRRLPLQYLDLTDCAALTDAGLRAAVRSCPQLVYLYLRRCIHLTDAGLKYVPAYCSGLRELSVSDCAGITDFGLYELAKLGAALRYLSVAKCTQVTDAGLKAIARRCYKLRYLNARGCEAVSDDSVTVLARSCPRLRALDLGKCDVSDRGLTALAESCPNLKKLSLRSCDLITDRGVQCIAYYCRGLQQLNIQDCQITIEGYRAVKKYCKRCIIEHTNPGFF